MKHLVIVLVPFVCHSAFAANLAALIDRESLRSQFLQEKKHLNFVREEEGRSEGYLCDGKHHFKLEFDADTRDIRFDLQDGYLDATLDLTQLYGRAEGRYRSQYSLCLPVKGWVGLGSDWAHASVRIFVEEQPNSDSPKIRLEVLESSLGTLHFGKGVPGWIEETVTGLVDQVLEHLWDTDLGNWIETRISEQLQKKLSDGTDAHSR